MTSLTERQLDKNVFNAQIKSKKKLLPSEEKSETYPEDALTQS